MKQQINLFQPQFQRPREYWSGRGVGKGVVGTRAGFQMVDSYIQALVGIEVSEEVDTEGILSSNTFEAIPGKSITPIQVV